MKKSFIFLIFFFFTSQLFGYSFGKNKFQTRDYDFKVFESDHFRIFSYASDTFMVKFAESVLEEAYDEYSAVFGIGIGNKTPVILYNSPKHFGETNVITDVIEEGTGGFTEIFKSRIVIPFSGSYEDFRHVLRHELVHAFQYAMLRRDNRSTIQSVAYSMVPLWCIEGLAEYLSSGWTADAERYLRNLLLSDKLPSLVELNYYGGYIVYKLGQLFYKYVDDTYGREKVGEFYSLVNYMNSVERAFIKAFGVSQEDFDLRLKDYIRKNYYHAFTKTSTPIYFKKYSDHEKWKNYYNVAPLISADGSVLYYIQERRGQFYIVKYSVATGEKLGTVFKSSSIPDFENIHILRPSLSLSEDGRLLVFSAQGGEGDNVYIFDTEHGKLVERLSFDVDAIYTPSISPDGKKVVFTGLKDGKSDLYLYIWKAKELKRLTADYYSDIDPSFDEKGNIIFASDRNDSTASGRFYYGSYAVFRYNVTNDSIERLTDYYKELSSPVSFGDSLLFFLARDTYSSINIFAYNLSTKEVHRVSDLGTEVRWFSVSKSGRTVASILYANGYDIYEMPNQKKFDGIDKGAFYVFEDTLFLTSKPYSPKFSFDWIYGSASYASIVGFQGAVAFGLSDELGDHQISFASDLSGDLANSNFEFQYFNLKNRADYGGSIYQLWDAGYIAYDTLMVSRVRGLMLLLSQPFSRSRRTELGLDFEYQTNYFFWETPLGNYIELTDLQEDRYLTAAYISHVLDNVYYNYIQDPLNGTRYYLSLLKSIPLDIDVSVAVSDFRHYYAFSESYILALRFKWMQSFGKDRVLFTFDGFSDLRGSHYAEFIGDKYILFNAEFRFPFVKKLSLGFPLPLDISGIDGVLFFDMGTCTLKRLEDIQVFHGFPRLGDLNADFGYGLRLWLGFAKLKVDFAYNTDFLQIYKPVNIRVSLGFDF
ncbi:MAG TPA: BamA/TamA family outer membrane protein [Candidatus Hydrothermia bacterium]|nr:BamA/TamA family outer membrane protein [Candidatus Hydrothermia bacterium]HOP32368.1 BamA/TamA family outer membrane protein [Candidatus Hydrothermia bacterium]